MIVLKSRHEIELMRASSAIVAEILALLRTCIRGGVSTAELDEVAERETRRHKARPAFKGYEVAGRVFPATLCVSINDEVVHGIPTHRRTLREGDIVGIDFGVCYQGYFSDAALTVGVGEVDEDSRRLMRVTEEALWIGIAQMRVGNRLGDVSAAVQGHVESEGFSVVRDFVGHGIGTKLHELPQLPNFGQRDRGIRLRAGMVLAIEPMVNAGAPQVRLLADGWTAVTQDGSRSAHFEHSVAITESGPLVLTAPEGAAVASSSAPERRGAEPDSAAGSTGAPA
jgi:methionyl aminopeptidase